MSSRPTVVMYTPDSIGLGHVKRHMAIAAEVVCQTPGASVILLVGSGVGDFFKLPGGCDIIKIPSVEKTGPDSWQPRSLSLEAPSTRRLRAGLIRETLEELRPDVFLVGHMPAGIWGELIPTLKLIRSLRFPTKVILGVRDILDDPDRIQRHWSKEGYYDFIEGYYDHVFIYGDGDIFPTADHYGLSSRIPGRFSYCGYVCSISSTEYATGRAEGLNGFLGSGGFGPLIVITGGGGHDAHPMMSACCAALKHLDAARAVRAVMITGPLMPDDQREQLRWVADGLPVEILPWSMRLPAYLAAADLVVTMGGYNSVLETVCLGKRAINIPRRATMEGAEQSMRAALFAKLGLLTHVPLDEATPERLAATIGSLLDEPLKPRPALPLDGAKRASHLIRKFLQQGDTAPAQTAAARLLVAPPGQDRHVIY
jgi:predicted glycosyltransferase